MSHDTNSADDTLYGVLNSRNIGRVDFGNHEFDTWYGNAAYFNPLDVNHSDLGYSFLNKLVHDPGFKIKKKADGHIPSDGYWLDKLYVCDYCFKYTANETEIHNHRVVCPLNKPKPTIGKLVYRDDVTPYYIRQIRGFKYPLYCQNMCLFGKLFLDDKSVYYNIDYFDFYVVYGQDGGSNFKPMGFFSKEVLSYDNNNNLACICIFPPFQRRHLGSLLIEFLYALAKVTPGQLKSGPEFPLSPYGKVSYLKFWSKHLANIIHNHLINKKRFTISELSDLTGYRNEDVLFTLEFMKLLKQEKNGRVTLMLGNFDRWCAENKFDPSQERNMLNPEYLLV
ncbi:uncharacterized protein CANTADRAFT_50365 [Suhomyces tanzawaensis NRRL Y-17324]|uniref:histone acetyltransferase n=1 Tax=Suhomyces tanzawaensis NRRL Y-17324 TaxID=984487 RepID=A0A1E4SJH1_9ASCO|nr:uncharacterized protein CANTADRAFT_50365 [Suhomyces tanzawaensis NRRL Y-17324]ODV79653.1 hypothetical protein CANTADRAFT_50365 [Suhomyces tanzawaensis NRRL Y-17324]